MQELLSHRAKTIRLRKQLRQAERRTDRAMSREEEELFADLPGLAEEEAGVEAVERPPFVEIPEMPLDDWVSIDGLDNFPWDIPNSQPQAAL